MDRRQQMQVNRKGTSYSQDRTRATEEERKAAVKLLTEGLYAELIETNVHVTVVFPGAVATHIAQNSGVVIQGLGNQDAHSFSAVTPDVAADTIIDGMRRNKFQVYIGKDARMMNFFYRLSPHRATRFMFRQMKALLPD